MAKSVFLVLLCLLSMTLLNSCDKNQVSKEPVDTHMTVLVNSDSIHTPICTGQLQSGTVTVYGGSYGNFAPNNTYPFVYVYVAKYNPDSETYNITAVNHNTIRILYSATNIVTATSGSISLSKITSTSQYFRGEFYGKVGDTTISGYSFTAETF